jgi:hypothetical protein
VRSVSGVSAHPACSRTISRYGRSEDVLSPFGRGVGEAGASEARPNFTIPALSPWELAPYPAAREFWACGATIIHFIFIQCYVNTFITSRHDGLALERKGIAPMNLHQQDVGGLGGYSAL